MNSNSKDKNTECKVLTVIDGIKDAERLKKKYPCGYLLMGKEIPADADLVKTVGEAMEAVKAGDLTLNELKVVLATKLSLAQLEFVFVMLSQRVDLYDVLCQVDEKAKIRDVKAIVKSLALVTVEGITETAMLSRAVAGTVGDVVFSVITSGLKTFSHFSLLECGVTNLFVCGVFSAFEVYRWAKDEITGAEAIGNIGEHAAGLIGGVAGGYGCAIAGGIAGAAAGSVIPIIGTAIGGTAGYIVGMMVGGVAGDFLARLIYRLFVPQERKPTKKQVARKAAKKFGINIDDHSFKEAHERFRMKLLNDHSDKHPNATQEEVKKYDDETRDNLACWKIVREYYKDQNKISEDAGIFETAEAFITVQVKRAYNTVTHNWEIVNAWFGDNEEFNKLDTERKEKIESVLIPL